MTYNFQVQKSCDLPAVKSDTTDRRECIAIASNPIFCMLHNLQKRPEIIVRVLDLGFWFCGFEPGQKGGWGMRGCKHTHTRLSTNLQSLWISNFMHRTMPSPYFCYYLM